MCTAHMPCTKASSSAQVGAQPLIFGLGAHKMLHYMPGPQGAFHVNSTPKVTLTKVLYAKRTIVDLLN